MNCDLNKGKCRRCGRLNETGRPDAQVHMMCRSSACRHLGAAVKPIKVECETCNGRKQVDEPANHCQVFARCLPFYRPADPQKWQDRPESEIYHLCRGCGSFAAALPPAPPAE